MDDLIERLGKAIGPDAKLNRDVFEAARDFHPDYGPGARIPKFTESIDAALTLVPIGMAWTLGQNVHHRYWQACINDIDSEGKPYARGFSGHTDLKSPAIALCIAALRARAALTAGKCE